MGGVINRVAATSNFDFTANDGPARASYRPSTRHAQRARKLEADRIYVRFQGLTALAEVSLTITRGEILGLIGPNGAGKTTLVDCLTGFQRPSGGRVLLDTIDTGSFGADGFRRAGIARTFQATRIFKNMTAVENAEVAGVGLGLNRRQARGRAMELLDRLGVAEKAESLAGTLPYTDQRRVGIARALMLGPAFVLLDEPAAGMSDNECEDLMSFVSALPAMFSCGVLLVEHNMSVVMTVSTRIHVLDSGRTVAEGAPHDVQRNPAVIGAYLGMEA